jgi:hypothetical protein
MLPFAPLTIGRRAAWTGLVLLLGSRRRRATLAATFLVTAKK